ncbi:50S ribosomal protein L13 [Candidatus Magnetomonas plexicatena]|uniref:50S ribosomal protein L13 n=1 Tax=Candidatus Magnetomonas plexicatena TaxID=2552947 RepID=UPI001C78D4C9|nr:50S ribosomal protein L13 [Nitrospirales bacterium LBB_01]
MKTRYVTKDEADRKWFVVDADGKILGRMAAKIAVYLRGKHKPTFTPNADTGDFVVVVNAEKVKLTGDKLTDKIYYHHSGYIGGIKAEAAKDRIKRQPEAMLKDAVWGMLPKNRLGRALIKKLKVYSGKEHPHSAQKPELLNL